MSHSKLSGFGLHKERVLLIYDVENMPPPEGWTVMDVIKCFMQRFVFGPGNRTLQGCCLSVSEASMKKLGITQKERERFAANNINVYLALGGRPKMRSTDTSLILRIQDFTEEAEYRPQKGVLVLASCDADYNPSLVHAVKKDLECHRVYMEGSIAASLMDVFKVTRHDYVQLLRGFYPHEEIKLRVFSDSPKTAAAAPDRQVDDHHQGGHSCRPDGGHKGSPGVHPLYPGVMIEPGSSSTPPCHPMSTAMSSARSPAAHTNWAASNPHPHAPSRYGASASSSSSSRSPYANSPNTSGAGSSAATSWSASHPSPPLAGSARGNIRTYLAPSPPAVATTSSSTELESSSLKVHWMLVKPDGKVVSVQEGVQGPLALEQPASIEGWLHNIFQHYDELHTLVGHLINGVVLYGSVGFTNSAAAMAAKLAMQGRRVLFQSGDGQSATYELYLKPRQSVPASNPALGRTLKMFVEPVHAQCSALYQGAALEPLLTELFSKQLGYLSLHCCCDNSGKYQYSWVNFRSVYAAAAARAALHGEYMPVDSGNGQSNTVKLSIMHAKAGGTGTTSLPASQHMCLGYQRTASGNSNQPLAGPAAVSVTADVSALRDDDGVGQQRNLHYQRTAASRTNPPGRAAVGVATDVAAPRDEDGIAPDSDDDALTQNQAMVSAAAAEAEEIEPSAAAAAAGDSDDDAPIQDQAMVTAATAESEASEIEPSAAAAGDDNDYALVQNQAMVTAAAAASDATAAPDAAADAVATVQEGATPTADVLHIAVPLDLRQSLLFDPLKLVDRPSLLPPTAAICSRAQTVRGLAASGRTLELLAISTLSGQQAASCVIQAVALQAVIESVQAQSFRLVNRRPLLPLAAMAATCSSSQLLDTFATPASSTAARLPSVPSILPRLDVDTDEQVDGEGLRIARDAAYKLLLSMKDLAQGIM